MRCLCHLLFIAASVMPIAFARGQEPLTTTSEPELIAILSGQSEGAQKALACKRLAIYGSSAAVPELTKLLTDEKLASWSRIALEAIPGKEADEALRKASESLSGRLLVGTLNSIGVRRDSAAVESLSAKLKHADADVASAAAVALGKIGGQAVGDILSKALAEVPEKVRNAVAEGCVLCADRMLTEGNKAQAATIFDTIRQANVPKQRIVEATRGAILARDSKQGVPLLIEQLRSGDKVLFQVGLRTAREIEGNEVGAALIAELERAQPDRAALIVQALADRPGAVDLPTIIRVASSGPKEVRRAAIGSLGRNGDATCVDPLLKIALEADAELLQSAKAALVEIPDEAVSEQIIAKLPSAQGALLQLLIEVIGVRRIDATQALVKALANPDKAIRTAALESLGSTVPQDQMSLLIEQATAPKNAEDGEVAMTALKTAAVRMPDADACAVALTAAMKKVPTATQVALLEIIAAVGSSKSLESLAAAAKGSDVALKDASTRLLGSWLKTDAAPVLLDLAQTGPVDKFQVRATRGYIRIIKQFVKVEKDRLAMCEKAFQIARQPDEQKLVVEVLRLNPSVGTLKLAIEATKMPGVKEEATQAAKLIAQKLGDNPEAKELMSKAGIAN